MDDPIIITAEQLSQQGVGIFNGKPMGLWANRKMKRKYLKEHKKIKQATYCEFCQGKTLTITDDFCKPVCELCGIVKDGEYDG